MNRRDFLKLSLLTASAYGLKWYGLPSITEAQAANTAAPTVVFVFLRGGADVLSLFPPRFEDFAGLNNLTDEQRRDYRNHPLVSSRGRNEGMQSTFLFGTERFPFGVPTGTIADPGTLALSIPGHPTYFHPAFESLKAELDGDKFALLLHTGSMNPTRSHFDQADFMESGAIGKKDPTGYLARASSYLRETLHRQNPIAIGSQSPHSLRGVDAALLASADELAEIGRLAGNRVDGSGLTRDQRLELFTNTALTDINCESQVYCRSIKGAKKTYGELAAYLNGFQTSATANFEKACELAAKLSKSPSTPPCMTIDFQGWDSHFAEDPKVQTSALYGNVSSLARGLKHLHHNMSSNAVVVVMSEFGRTLAANGSRGTDHGRGSAMMVMCASGSSKVSRRQIVGMPTGWDLNRLDGTGDNAALEVKTDFRKIVGEVIQGHLRVPLTAPTGIPGSGIATVFDGLTSYGAPRNIIIV
jgi:uncharacterized protein (DUF1501 family)